jgi:hypothetical protein
LKTKTKCIAQYLAQRHREIKWNWEYYYEVLCRFYKITNYLSRKELKKTKLPTGRGKKCMQMLARHVRDKSSMVDLDERL